MKHGYARFAGAAAHEGSALPCASIQYRQAVAEFDCLWESGDSKLRPEKMTELLTVIEAFEDASHEHSSKGITHAARNP